MSGFSWAPYQHSRPSPSLVDDWISRYPSANWAIVTGQVSGIIVVDIDGDAGKEALRALGPDNFWQTMAVETARGMQLYYRHPGRPVRNFVKRLPEIDLRADGGYVVAPGSIHPSGAEYRWYWPTDMERGIYYNRIDPYDIVPLPQQLHPLIFGERPSADSPQSQTLPPAIRVASAYALGALRRELARVTSARKGSRSDTLNAAAYSLGQLVADGHLEREATVSALHDAALPLQIPDDPDDRTWPADSLRTIHSGLTAGMANPRSRRHGQEARP